MLGVRLKELRGKRTQQDIADLIGVARASYSHYENDHVQPDNQTLTKIAGVFGVSVDYLLGRESDVHVVKSEIDKDRESAYAAIDRLHGSKLQLAKSLLEELSKDGKP